MYSDRIINELETVLRAEINNMKSKTIIFPLPEFPGYSIVNFTGGVTSDKVLSRLAKLGLKSPAWGALEELRKVYTRLDLYPALYKHLRRPGYPTHGLTVIADLESSSPARTEYYPGSEKDVLLVDHNRHWCDDYWFLVIGSKSSLTENSSA